MTGDLAKAITRTLRRSNLLEQATIGKLSGADLDDSSGPIRT